MPCLVTAPAVMRRTDRLAEHAGGYASPESGAGPRAAGATCRALRSSARYRARPVPVRPSSDSEADRRGADRYDAFWNGAFLIRCSRASIRRPLPRACATDRRRRSEHPPAGGFLRPQLLRPRLHGGRAAKPRRGQFACAAPARALPRWAGRSMPSGLTEVLIRLRDHYGNPDVYITENGACYNDVVCGRRHCA